MNSNRSITISDAYDLIAKKILIGKMSAQLSKYQMLYSESSMKVQQHAIDISKERIKLLNQLNDILEQQLNEFDDIRHQECVDIYGYIDELDKPNDAYNAAIDSCLKYEELMKNLIPKIDAIESTIPATQLITNYKISEKPVAPTAYNCSTQASGFGADTQEPPPE